MARDHPLRPDREAEEFYRLVRMKEHPDRQPRRAVTVHRRDHDDGHTDQDFESDWVYGKLSYFIDRANPMCAENLQAKSSEGE